MAVDKELPDFDALAAVADDDLVYIVDVSDTTDSAAGSSRRALAKNVRGTPPTTAENAVGPNIVVNRQYEPGDVRRYGNNTTPGTTDMRTAIQNAINSWNGAGGVVDFQGEDYLITGAITGAAGVILRGVSNRDTRIVKGFNGDMFTGALAMGMERLQLDGEGGTYTGRGLVLGSGDDDVYLDNVRIVDMNGYCVEVSTANGGKSLHIDGGAYNRTTVTDPAIKFPVDTTPSYRWITNVDSGGGHLVDFGGCDNAIFIGNRSGDLTFGTDSAKVICVGNRLPSAGADITVNGTSHVINGNILAGDLVFDTDTTQCQARGNIFDSGHDVVDNATDNSNSFDTKVVSYTPTWTGSGSNPAIGNGTIIGSYQRNGAVVTVNIDLTIGSTTTFGSGDYSFSLPFQNNNDISLETVGGGGYYLDSGTARVTGLVARIQSGASTVEILAGSTGFVTPTSPITWATSDEIHLSFSYLA